MIILDKFKIKELMAKKKIDNFTELAKMLGISKNQLSNILSTKFKPIRVDVFYNAATKNLLGYKEDGKDYVRVENTTNTIKTIKSFMNRLRFLGFETTNLNIHKILEENRLSYFKEPRPSHHERQGSGIYRPKL